MCSVQCVVCSVCMSVYVCISACVWCICMWMCALVWGGLVQVVCVCVRVMCTGANVCVGVDVWMCRFVDVRIGCVGLCARVVWDGVLMSVIGV